MTITFYILLTYLNLTGKRKSFVKKTLEKKMNWYFGIYSVLWLLIPMLTIFTFFTSIALFVPLVAIVLWMIAELIFDDAILIKGKNKIILQKEFMSVDKDSLKEAEAFAKINKNHHK